MGTRLKSTFENVRDLRPRPRDDLHLARRLFHIMSGCGIVAVSFFLESKKDFALFLGSLTLLDLVVEGARLIFPRFNLFVLSRFRRLLREGEENRLSGISYYLLGSLLAVILFPREIAVLSILFLAFGDPIASLVGVMVGRRHWPSHVSPSQKSFEGSLACLFFCGVMTWFVSYEFAKTAGLNPSDRLLFSIVGGFSAALGELLPLRTDDNFALPLISGTCLWVVAAFFNLVPGLYL